jgi:transcriptional regulator with XRE-family HTH domain
MAQEEIIFPNNIRNIRLAAGMKMTELARQTGLSLSAVSKIEKGLRRLNQNQLLNICRILGCNYLTFSSRNLTMLQTNGKAKLNAV